MYSFEDASTVLPCVPCNFGVFPFVNKDIIPSSDPIHLIPESTVLFTKGTAYTVSSCIVSFEC